MSEIRLFKVKNEVKELNSSPVLLEKNLQNFIEKNMETLFGVTFIKSEYVITNGRMDSIGLDENNCPVIFEYKRSSNENVINQGLFYLDWLMDHKEAFEKEAKNVIDEDRLKKIDWSLPCVICVANDFNKFDVHAVNQIDRNIKLVRYSKYDDELLMFEYINTPNVEPISDTGTSDKKSVQKTHVQKLESLPENIINLYNDICMYIEDKWSDLTKSQLKFYLAYRKISNVFCIEIYQKYILIHVNIDPTSIELEDGFTRDVTNIGHLGTGNLEITISNIKDFDKAKHLLEKAYNESIN